MEINIGQKYDCITIIGIVGKNKRGYKIYQVRCDCGNFFDYAHDNFYKSTFKQCKECDTNYRRLDLQGKKFGKVLVIELNQEKLYGEKISWKCRCDCGKQFVCTTNALQMGRTKSCGCEINYNKVNYSGQKIGRLTVIEKFEQNKNSEWSYLCKCDCGNETLVSTGHLQKQTIKSCGCLRKELAVIRTSNQIGEKNPNYHGGNSTENQKIRGSAKYKKWTRDILKRDKHCQICGDSNELEAHHLEGFVNAPDQRFDPNNGVCLCNLCHTVFHLEYGYGDNSSSQFYEFKSKLGV